MAAGAPYEVNVPETIRKAVELQIKENVFAEGIFDDAAAQAMRLMELDSYPRFASRPANNQRLRSNRGSHNNSGTHLTDHLC